MSTKETKYQVYTSSMQAHKLVMPCGKVLHVTKGKYVTCNEAEIEFIDAEIKAGFKYLKKGGTTTSATADPMEAYRAKIAKEAIAEYLAKETRELEEGDEDKKIPAAPVISPTLATPAPVTSVVPKNSLDLSSLMSKSNS